MIHPVFVVVVDDLHSVDVHLFADVETAKVTARQRALDISDVLNEAPRAGRVYSATCPDGEEVWVTMKAIDEPRPA